MKNKILNKNFLLLNMGQFVSIIGNEIIVIVSIFWLKKYTESASLVSLSLAIHAFAYFFFSPLSGPIIDYFQKNRILVVLDVIAGIISIIVGIIFLNGIIVTKLLISLIFLMQFVSGIALAFIMPTVNAIIPEVIHESQITRANSFKSAVKQIGNIVGKSTGGLLYKLFGTGPLFIVNGISFVFSAISEFFIKVPKKIKQKNENINYLANIKEGFKYLWKNKGVRTLIITYALLEFALTPLMVLLPFFVEDFLYLGSEWYGIIMACFAIGMVIGFFTISFLKIENKQRGMISYIMLFIFAGSLSLLAIIRSLFIILPCFVIAGSIFGAFNSIFHSGIQLNTETKYRGRVFSVIGTINGGLSPLGMLLSGILFDLFNKNLSVIFIGASVVAMLPPIIILFHRETSQTLCYES